ncbi:MAG: SdrD B-like domain-containing protein [Clostridia bacterium]|nr:SdrD B-like domain-containing protein [Clostridia bacterium]
MEKGTGVNRQIMKNSMVYSVIILLLFGLFFSLIGTKQIKNFSAEIKTSEAEYDYGEELKSQAKIECNKSSVTSLTDFNDIELIATLITDNEEFCKLYKGTQIVISVPDGVTIDSLGEITLLGETQLEIWATVLNENKISIGLRGEQTSYNTGDINAQIKIPARVCVDKMINNISGEITMEVSNTNDTATRTYKTPISVTSAEGIISYMKIENYNTNQDVLELYNIEENVVNLEMDSTAKTVNVTGKILNNHNVNLSDVKLQFAPTWIHANGQTEAATIISEAFTDNEIIIDNFEIGQVIEFTAQVSIPADLYFNEKLNLGFNTVYTYSDSEQQSEIKVTMQTEQKAGVGVIEKLFTSEEGSLRVETLAQVGNDIIVNDDDVKEGSTIRYTMTLTNLTENKMENVKTKMTKQNNNTNFYDLKFYDTNVFEESLYTYAELEDGSVEKEIGTLEPKQIKTIYYEVVVGNDTENKIVSNLVDVYIGENVEQTATINNNIVDSDLKLNLSSDLVKVIGDNSITKDDGNLLITLNLDTINLKGETITEDSRIEMDLPNYVESVEVMAGEDEDEVESTFENQKLTVPLRKIEKENGLVKVNLLINRLPTVEERLNLSYKILFDEAEYTSNVIEEIIKSNEIYVDAEICADLPETTIIGLGDIIQYTVNVKNNGLTAVEAEIKDQIPSTLLLGEVLLNGEIFTEYEYDEYGQFTCIRQLAPNEEVTLKLSAAVNAEDDVSNNIQVEVNNSVIKEVEMNHRISSESDDTEYDFVETPYEEGQEEGTIGINGRVWLDLNKDGKRTDDEQNLKGITVRLINTNKQNEFVKDANGNNLKVITDDNGQYNFTGLEEASYFVLFEYDTADYELTTYQKEGVDSTINSDVQDYTGDVEGKQGTYAITKALEANNTLTDIDMGLVNTLKFDLKIDKYISKVTVKNTQGTANYSFADKSTAKVEIPGKYMKDSVVIAEYTIRITNQGEIAGFVTNLVDYLPKDMNFYTESNKDWFVAEDGVLHNISLSNIAIEPGKTSDVTLVLTKTMTKDNTGTSENKAEIGSYSNVKEREDIDLNNNKTTANLIVSVKTGEIILYTTLIIACIAIVAVGIYIIKKRVID